MAIFFQIIKPSLPLSIGSIGNHWQQETIIRKEGYPHYHWLQTENGDGNIQIEGKTINLTSGEGILIKPFTPHSYFSKKNWKTKFVTFNGSLSDDFEKIVGKDKYITAKDSEHFSYSGWIDKVIENHLSDKKNQKQLTIESYEFLINLTQLNNFNDSEDNNYSEYVLPVINKLSTDFSQKITLEELSKELYVSPQYLSRIFKKYTNETIFSYLQAIRINKAKELLINHISLKIQAVSDLCGFSDSSYFISLFKKNTGYTPLQFRKFYTIRKH